MVDLRCFPDLSADQRRMRRLVRRQITDVQLAEVDAVSQHLGSTGLVALQDLRNLNPRRTPGSCLERLTHLRRFFRINLELAAAAIFASSAAVADRHVRRSEDTLAQRSLLGRLESSAVSVQLHLRDRQEHVARQLPFRRLVVKRLGNRNDSTTGVFDPLDCLQGVADPHTAETVELRNDDSAQITGLDASDQGVQDRPAQAAAGHVELRLGHFHGQATRFGVTLDSVGLLLRRDQRFFTVANTRHAHVPAKRLVPSTCHPVETLQCPKMLFTSGEALRTEGVRGV